jgi:hypothetical protein
MKRKMMALSCLRDDLHTTKHLRRAALTALLLAPLLLAACQIEAPKPVAQAPLTIQDGQPVALLGAASRPQAPVARADDEDQELAQWRAELAAKQAARDANLAAREARRAALMAQPDPQPSTRKNPFAKERISCRLPRRR